MLATLKELLQTAKENNYAVLAPNFTNIYSARVLIECAEKYRAPLLLSYATAFKPIQEIKDYRKFIRIVRDQAAGAGVPIGLHLDHAFELDDIAEAIDVGYTSVMIDASSEPWDINVARTQKAVAMARPAGVSVEAELGHVTTGADYISPDERDSKDHRKWLTEPDQASRFVALTGIDALAIAIGTVHGTYHSTPCLDFERLQKISAVIDVPLVLHGASGTGAEKIRQGVEQGICKINVYTDLIEAVRREIAAMVSCTPRFSPHDLALAQSKGLQKAMHDYLHISGSIGKFTGYHS